MLSKMLVSLWLVWMSVLDIKSRRVPVWLMGIGGVLALVFLGEDLLQTAGEKTWMEYAGALIFGGIPGAFLLLVAFFTKAIGYGDGIVMVLLGVMLGIRKSFFVLCTGLFIASLSSVIMLILRKVKRNSCLPFVPFLTAGWFLAAMG